MFQQESATHTKKMGRWDGTHNVKTGTWASSYTSRQGHRPGCHPPKMVNWDFGWLKTRLGLIMGMAKPIHPCLAIGHLARTAQH